MTGTARPSGDIPPISRFLGEARVLKEWWAGREHLRTLAGRDEGRGHHVLVLPGLLASDWMTMPLRRALSGAGYRPHGWGLGRNLGLQPGLIERLDRRLGALADEAEGPVTLVGWSLGGLYAREMGKRMPQAVAGVITLGSPFSGDIRANRAWRLYERLTGHPVDRLPLDIRLSEKPSPPTIAIWSGQDGIVAPACCRGRAGETDAAIEVDSTHLGLVCSVPAIEAVLAALRRLRGGLENGRAVSW